MDTKLGQTVYADGVRSVLLTRDEVIIDEVVRQPDGAIHHTITFSRDAWHAVMEGSAREFRQEQEG